MFLHLDDTGKINADLWNYIRHSYCHVVFCDFSMESLLIVRSTELGKKNMPLPETVLRYLAANVLEKLFRSQFNKGGTPAAAITG